MTPSPPEPFAATAQQQAIIEHPLGPLKVAAGAGTGKTSTLAHRIAAVVSRDGIRPDQALGITFTNKAAQELEQRIRAVLGDRLPPGEAVDVTTYHGFAARILQDHGLRAGIERSASIITPTFARQLLLDAVTAGTFQHLDITSRRKVIGDLDKLASDLGDNLLLPRDVRAPRPATDVEARRNEYLQVLERYEASKRRLNTLDYADLIRLAHVTVTEHPDVAATVRSQYRIVLLDEYQDTNPAQRALLQAIFGDGFPLTAVGDREQTIYEWRGATLENFARFTTHFPQANGAPAPERGLTLNRRSGRKILAVANAIRSRVDQPSSDPLRPRRGAPPGDVVASWYRTTREEADDTAGEIVRLHDEEGVAWRNMAVLFRKNKDISLMRDALEDHGVPIQVANLGGLLTIPEVVEVHAWLRLLGDPEDTPALARVLMGTRHRVGMGEIRQLTDWVRSRDRAASEADPDHLPRHTLLEALEDADQLAFDPATRASVEAFVATYRRLLTVAQGASLVELVQRILYETDAWRDVQAMPGNARMSARLNLYRFLDLAESWSPLEGRPSLPAFLAYLELMQEEDIEELDTARISPDDAVTLLTVHRAKGLEWDVVFIPAAYRDNFPSRVRIYEDPLVQPGILPYEHRLDRADRPALSEDMTGAERKALLRERHLDQEWRLAYVAVTRARRRLYVTGAAWTGTPAPNKTPAEPGPVLELVAGLDGSAVGTWVQDPGERPERLRYEGMEDSPDPLFADGWEAALRGALDDRGSLDRAAASRGVLDAYHARMAEYQEMLFSLPEPQTTPTPPEPLRVSVTGLVTYATCPKRYYWSEVDRLPRRASASARRGVELHRRIELHNRGAIPLEDLDPLLYDVTPGEDVTADEASSAYTRFMASRFAQTAPAYIEAPFDLRLSEDVRIRGRIDAIYLHAPGHWEVVDFKSGRPSSNPATMVQLEAYALAAREAGFTSATPDRLDVTFAYFGGGTDERSTRVDDEWLQAANDHLETMVEAIRDEQFEPEPSPACSTCDFTRFCSAGRTWLDEHS